MILWSVLTCNICLAFLDPVITYPEKMWESTVTYWDREVSPLATILCIIYLWNIFLQNFKTPSDSTGIWRTSHHWSAILATTNHLAWTSKLRKISGAAYSKHHSADSSDTHHCGSATSYRRASLISWRTLRPPSASLATPTIITASLRIETADMQAERQASDTNRCGSSQLSWSRCPTRELLASPILNWYRLYTYHIKVLFERISNMVSD